MLVKKKILCSTRAKIADHGKFTPCPFQSRYRHQVGGDSCRVGVVSKPVKCTDVSVSIGFGYNYMPSVSKEFYRRDKKRLFVPHVKPPNSEFAKQNIWTIPSISNYLGTKISPDCWLKRHIILPFPTLEVVAFIHHIVHPVFDEPHSIHLSSV